MISFFFAGCNSTSKHIISKIPEASDICYCADTQTLVVANDEGKFYEITAQGKILSENYLEKDDECNIFFADDSGAVLKYKLKELTLHN